MAILGKDLFYVSPNFFEFTALFSDEGVEIFDTAYQYCQLTTDFLNCDFSAYEKITGSLQAACDEGDTEKIAACKKDAGRFIVELPLFKDFTPGRKLQLEHAEPGDFYHLAHDLSLIRERYAWFLQEIFHQDLGKVGANRYATQIEENGMSALVSGRSLGLSTETDPAPASVQFEVRISAATKQPQLFEKMVFTRLADFIYTELFKGMMHGNVPKRCKNCGRWFLRGRGFSYEYCDGIAPGEQQKTCREVGAAASYKDKLKNNPVWEIHLRAYKKYYARVLKKKMTKAEFSVWAAEAEKLRDATMPLYLDALNHQGAFSLEEYTARLNAL